MELRGLSLIGSGTGTAGGAPFRGFDPVAGRPAGPVFHSAQAVEIEQAVSLAAAAAPAWAELAGERRAAFLEAIAGKLDRQATILAERAREETGLPLDRCLGEVARTSGQLRLYGAAARRGDWVDARIETAAAPRQPLPKPDHRSMLRPLGPVIVFGSSNFPFAYSVAGGDTASAFAAGCPVIVKAHPAHPGTGELVGQLIAAAVSEQHLPEGSFSLLFDAGFAAGQALVRHPAVRAVGFTGSLSGGRALVDLAAARPEPIPVYAEMGSLNPVFILPGALRERSDAIVTGLHASATSGVGQFCTNPGLIVLQRSSAAESFIEALTAKLAATPEGAMLTPGIAAAFRKNVGRRARSQGVALLIRTCALATEQARNSPPPFTAGQNPPQTYAQPVWFETDAATFIADRGLSAEIFGPSSLVVWCHDRAAMRDVARHLEGSLTATLHAGEADASGAKELVELLAARAGRVVFNGYPTGLEVSPAIVHGGPYPATSDGGRSTSVGTRALNRWARLICYQNFSDDLLPAELQNANPLGILRLVDGEYTRSRSEFAAASGRAVTPCTGASAR